MKTLNRLVFKAVYSEPYNQEIQIGNYNIFRESESERSFTFTISRKGKKIAQWSWNADIIQSKIYWFKDSDSKVESNLREAIQKAGFWTMNSTCVRC